jgi:two-component system, chemotaxis family, protein-glutamate methylesterase/glutaminase
MIRVLVVDDSPFVRQALARMLGKEADIQVVGLAIDGQDGVEKALMLRPDVVTLDVQMPRMGGLEALKRIMAECPTPVLLLSSLTREGASVTLQGLELGALDFVDKSRVQGHMNLLDLSEELKAKVRALAGVKPPAPFAPPTTPAHRPPPHPARCDLVVIGTSTGGPPALQAIIPRLPEDFPAPVVVVQHMPVGFTRSLAERLDARSSLRVREAEDGESLDAGVVYVAPAGVHLKLRKRGDSSRIHLDEEPRSALHRPSVDVVMSAAARVYGKRTLGVLLTGMGSDGVEGLRAIREAGGQTLAESEATSIIYGMPKAAAEAGVVDRVVDLPRIADEILAAV